ncbi:MAG TPA: DUF4253 domain-containing protein, partial [Gaiellaceae bacterium]|nr:DUF4253 domain-containing protein [Gaiellaceae bacterium]
VTATLRLARRPEGTAVIEIITSRRLEDFHPSRWVRWDHEKQEHLWEDLGVRTPAEYLREPSAFGFMSSGPERGKWRHVRVRAGAPVEGLWRPLAERQLDLSEGSEERAVLAVLATQDEIPLVWINEGVEVAFRAPEAERLAWQIALENTHGMGAKEWKEEMAELAWQESPSWRPGPRPRRHRPRTASPPTQPLPFFASRSGTIPRARGAELAGLALPAGRRYPRGLPAAYWGSDEPLANVRRVASALASAFPETGLWPLLWRWEEDPNAYLGGHGDLDAIDHVDVAAVMQEFWSRTPWPPGSTEPFTDFPGLAPSSGDGRPPAYEPFQEAAEEAARLLLVPCNRPADAITMLGGLGGEVEGPIISAVFRTWEERFSAVAYEVEPDLVMVAVAAPPTSDDHALRVAAEHMAFCPPDDGGAPGSLRKLAGALMTHTEAARRERTSRTCWYVGWYD